MAVVIPNPKLLDELKKEPDFQTGQRTAAEALAGSVRSVAPEASGDYVDSIEVVQSGDTLYVATKDFAGHIIEFGSVNNPPYAPLRRGAQAAGFHLQEK